MEFTKEELDFIKAFTEYVIDKKDCFVPNEEDIKQAKSIYKKIVGDRDV